MPNRTFVVDLTASSPEPEPEPKAKTPRRSQQPIPESHFVTPSEDSDSESDCSLQVVWGVRKKKDGPQVHINQNAPKPSKISKVPRPPEHAPSQPSNHPNPVQQPRPLAPVQPHNFHFHAKSHNPQTPVQSSGPSRPGVYSRPDSRHLASAAAVDSKPVSIVSPAAREWLERSRFRIPTNRQPSATRQPLPSSAPKAAASATPKPVLSSTHQSPALSAHNPAPSHVQSPPTSLPAPKPSPSRSLLAPKPSPSVNASPKNAQPAVEAVRQPVQPKLPSATEEDLSVTRSRPSTVDTFITAIDSRSSSNDSLGIPTNSLENVAKRKAATTATNNARSTKRPRTILSSISPSVPASPISEPFDEPVPSVEAESEAIMIDSDVPPSRFNFPDDLSQIRPFPNNFGKPWTAEEDALIVYLKEDKRLTWKELERFFIGRKWSSMQSRYSTNLSPKALKLRGKATSDALQASDMRRPRRQRPPTNSHAVDAAPTESHHADDILALRNDSTPTNHREARHIFKRAVPPLSSLIRHREIGGLQGREWPRRLHSEVKDYAFSTLGPSAYLHGASGDVSAVAWSRDGGFFAAGAVAVTDSASRQYNKQRNLIFGSISDLEAKELPEHRIEQQDGGSLFATVQMVDFSPDSSLMYSVGIDKRLNMYEVQSSVSDTAFVRSFDHPKPVDFLTVSSNGLVATGCRLSDTGAVRVFTSATDPASTSTYFSGTGTVPAARKYPSALKWGAASHHSHLLLAGFSCEVEVVYEEDDARDKQGEVCLWDLSTEQRLEVGAPNRNVFDIAWNPNPSSASSVFAVASRVISKVNVGIHSVVRLYSPKEGDPKRASFLTELECPAWDINDVLYSPYDDHIIAAGSTEGKVYIWDLRFVKRDQLPARILSHGEPSSVLPHGKKRWEADTGVRFLSWGEDRTQLYTGSSDGLVKSWNPYRSDDEMHVRDVAQFRSAIMSGAFSPDYCNLLIGEEQSRLNLLTIGNEDKTLKDMVPFTTHPAPLPQAEEHDSIAASRFLLDTGRIELRPLGTMPIRQAVQGPYYDGPYCKDPPSAVVLRAEAQRFQEKLYRTRHRRDKQLKKSILTATEECRADCAHNPSLEFEDSERSTDRIPDQLRQRVEPGHPARVPGLNATCSDCGAAARLQEGYSAKVLCERCGFTCFRCGNTAQVSPRAKVLECLTCGVAWSIGALGYDVIESGNHHSQTTVADVQDAQNGVDLMEELGDTEREFYFLRDLSDDSGLDGLA